MAAAIAKFERRSAEQGPNMTQLVKSFHPEGKERFVVKVGDRLKSVKTADILLFFSQEKATYIFSDEGRRFPIDYTMERVYELLSPDKFFRVSRKHIINIDAIKDIIAFTNSRLEVVVDQYQDDQIIVARERVQDFKNWLDR